MARATARAIQPPPRDSTRRDARGPERHAVRGRAKRRNDCLHRARRMTPCTRLDRHRGQRVHGGQPGSYHPRPPPARPPVRWPRGRGPRRDRSRCGRRGRRLQRPSVPDSQRIRPGGLSLPGAWWWVVLFSVIQRDGSAGARRNRSDRLLGRQGAGCQRHAEPARRSRRRRGNNVWIADMGDNAIRRLQQPHVLNVTASPASLDFGTQAVQTTSTPRPATATSSGTSPATFSVTTLGGANPGDFVVVSDGCVGAVIASGAKCQVSVRSHRRRQVRAPRSCSSTTTPPARPRRSTDRRRRDARRLSVGDCVRSADPIDRVFRDPGDGDESGNLACLDPVALVHRPESR